jgi:hypothetical protein
MSEGVIDRGNDIAFLWDELEHEGYHELGQVVGLPPSVGEKVVKTGVDRAPPGDELDDSGDTVTAWAENPTLGQGDEVVE